MKVYVNVPTSGVTATISLAAMGALYDATHCDGVRVVLDWRGDWAEIAETAAAVFEAENVLPVLDDETDPGYVSVLKKDEFINWAAQACLDYKWSIVEGLNEPLTIPSHNMNSAVYADTINRLGIAIHRTAPGTQLAVACEALKAGGTVEKTGYWADVRTRLAPENFDLCAIHPYRYHPDEQAWSRNHWRPWAQQANGRLASLARWFFGPGHRADEHLKWLVAAKGKDVIVTETGWNVRDGVSEAQQAKYITAELDFYRSMGVEIVCLYARGDDLRFPSERWGLLRGDGTPKPAAAAVKAWIEKRQTT